MGAGGAACVSTSGGAEEGSGCDVPQAVFADKLTAALKINVARVACATSERERVDERASVMWLQNGQREPRMWRAQAGHGTRVMPASVSQLEPRSDPGGNSGYCVQADPVVS